MSATGGKKTTIIALVDAFGYTNAEADLGVYRAEFGLPACTTANKCFTKYNQKGKKRAIRPRTSVGPRKAPSISTWPAPCARAARSFWSRPTPTRSANLAAAVNEAATLGAHVISNSYGGGESGSQAYEAAYNHAGIAVTASTGDDGYGAAVPGHLAVCDRRWRHRPFSESQRTRGWSELAWTGGGSGCSAFYAKPAWQTDTDAPCGWRPTSRRSPLPPPACRSTARTAAASRSGWSSAARASPPARRRRLRRQRRDGELRQRSLRPTRRLNDVTTGSNGTCPPYFCNAEAVRRPDGSGHAHGNKAY